MKKYAYSVETEDGKVIPMELDNPFQAFFVKDRPKEYITDITQIEDHRWLITTIDIRLWIKSKPHKAIIITEDINDLISPHPDRSEYQTLKPYTIWDSLRDRLLKREGRQ